MAEKTQQIMDPKMDSGHHAPGETLHEDYDILRKLLPEEVLGIMDQMLCYEVNFSLWDNYAAVHNSDTDPRSRRWHGTRVIRYHNPSSHHYILIDYYGRSRRRCMKPASIGTRYLSRGIKCYIWFYGHIAWA